MADNASPAFTRRQWLGFVSPVAAASLTANLVSNTAAAADASTASAPAETLGARVYNIRDFGAKGDGKTLDTAALQAAIDACNRDQGGTVLVPAGVFLIGTTELKSNVTLHIAARGKLLGAAEGKQYHAADAIPLHGDSTLEDGNVGLLYAVEAENISVEGPGTIDGQGDQFRSPARGEPSPAGLKSHERPYHMLFHRCANVTVRDIYLFACAYHSIRAIQSKFMKFDGIHIYNRVNHNNDGFHFISSEYVHISNCDIICQDDACALFGSCKFVTVTNCTFSTRWSVFRFGGGVAENISVSNCIIYETFGCPVKIHCSPGSRFENMTFSDLILKNVTGPFSIGLGNRRRSSDQSTEPPKPGIVRNIAFRNIQATVVVPTPLPDVHFTVSPYNPGELKSCIGLNGVEAFIENISFTDMRITFPGGGTAEDAALRDVPKVVGEYYQAGVFPSYALYARNVRGLTLDNVRFEVAGTELRPAIVLDNVQDAAINSLSVQGTSGSESTLRFINTKDVLVTSPRLLAESPAFLQVEGDGCAAITIDGGDTSKASTAVRFKNGAPNSAVKLRA